MAERDRMHDSMRFHPKAGAPKAYVYHPDHPKGKLVTQKKAMEMVRYGEWFNTPADFPANVKLREVKAEEKKASAAELSIKVSDRARRVADQKIEEAKKLIAEAQEAEAEADRLEEAADELNSPSDNIAADASGGGDGQGKDLEPTTTEEPPVTTSETDEETSQGEDGEEVVDEGPQPINPPAEFTNWTKAQMEDFVISNNLKSGEGLDMRLTNAKLIDEVISLCQDYNAALIE